MNKRQYIAPGLTVVTFKVEQGFNASSNSTGYNPTSFLDMFTLTQEENYNAQAQENWNDGGNVFGSW